MQVQSTPVHARSPWPWGIAATLGVVVIANFIMMRAAFTHPSTAAAEDPYAASLAWNEHVALRTASLASGWSVQASFEGGNLRVFVHDKQGLALESLRVQVRAERFDNDSKDRSLALTQTSPDSYSVAWDPEATGLFELAVTLQDSESGSSTWLGAARLNTRHQSARIEVEP